MIARKWLSALSVAAVLSAAACSGGGVGEEGVAEPLPEGSGSVKDRAVEIAFYSSGREPLFVEAVRQKFPEYTIKYIQKGTGFTFPEMIAGGQTFDIYVENARTYARDLVGSKLEQDLTELAKRHQIDLNRFEPGGLEQMMSAGGLYGLPIYGSGLVLYYNKEIFDRFGVPYPKDGMTWEETYELAKRLTRTDNQPYYGYWVKTKSYLRKNQYSLPFADLETDKAVIVNERWKKTIETVYERFSDIEGMEGFAWAAVAGLGHFLQAEGYRHVFDRFRHAPRGWGNGQHELGHGVDPDLRRCPRRRCAGHLHVSRHSEFQQASGRNDEDYSVPDFG